MAEKPQPVRVLYCPVCSLPAEYCEFGPDFEKCKPWLIQNAPDLYPDLLKEANAKEAGEVSNQLQSTSISSAAGDGAASSGILVKFVLAVAYLPRLRPGAMNNVLHDLCGSQKKPAFFLMELQIQMVIASFI
uniref:DENR N-terminal domain-containing protein n=1 Tax=Cucumis melo TaxID=3656 RepID=A0A9I9CC67_CUCME